MADLASISTDWYVRLEQGRSVQPSASTLAALARALRLSTAEQIHLRTLAQPAVHPPWRRESVPELVRQIVESLNQPAYVTGRRWDILTWSTAAARVFGDFAKTPEPERNILLYMFTQPAARHLFADTWEAEAKRMLALFRATYDLWARDPAFAELQERLCRGSREFVRWWQAHEVRPAQAGRKHLRPPKQSAASFAYASFQSNDDPALTRVGVWLLVPALCVMPVIGLILWQLIDWLAMLTSISTGFMGGVAFARLAIIQALTKKHRPVSASRNSLWKVPAVSRQLKSARTLTALSPLPPAAKQVQVANRSKPKTLADLSWQEFELMAGELYRRPGYTVEMCSGDGSDVMTQPLTHVPTWRRPAFSAQEDVPE